jgi:hypothetical protein
LRAHTATPGIELRGRERRSRGIDYNAEVAFEKKPAPGFYDTGAEAAATRDMQAEFRPTTVEEMEGKRRKVRTRVWRRACARGGGVCVCVCECFCECLCVCVWL